MENPRKHPLRMLAERIAKIRQESPTAEAAIKQTDAALAKAVAKVSELLARLRTKK